MKLMIEFDADETDGINDTSLLRPLQGILTQLSKPEVERILSFLKHWNDKRPANAD